MNKREVELLSDEIEMLMAERTRLLKVAGAAAILVANADANELPSEVAEAAELLSRLVNELSEESLKDALDAVHAHSTSGV